MSNVHRIKDWKLIEQEAATWVWRMDEDAVPPDVRAEYEGWLKEDPRHARAIDEYHALWGRLDGLAESKREEKIRTVTRGIDEQEGMKPFALSRAGIRRFAAMAACLILAVVVTVLIRPVPQQDMPAVATYPDQQNFSTAVGEFRTVELSDGSLVEMNTNTIIRVDYTQEKRQVILRKGEAHFEVAKNPDRPFVVAANGTSVRAVGTAFNVRINPDSPVEVLVTEGTVEIEEQYTEADTQTVPAREQVFLTAGQGISVDRAAPEKITTVSQGELSRALAWRKGMLIFEGDTLASVVDELSRYTEKRFIIIDDQISDRRVGGFFRTDDVDGLLSVLEEGLSVKIEHQGERVILLSDAETD